MNRERLPTTGADESAKVTLHLTRAEMLALDRFCGEIHFIAVVWWLGLKKGDSSAPIFRSM